jgi:ankyrin repeat protein
MDIQASLQYLKNDVNSKLEKYLKNINVDEYNDIIINILSDENDDLLSVIPFLLEKNININMKSHTGMTLLMLASECFNVEVVKLLLEKGADANIQDNSGYTALSYATLKDYVDKKEGYEFMKNYINELDSINEDEDEDENELANMSLEDVCNTIKSMIENEIELPDISPENSYNAIKSIFNYINYLCIDYFRVPYNNIRSLSELLNNSYNIIELLIKYGADVNVKSCIGNDKFPFIKTIAINDEEDDNDYKNFKVKVMKLLFKNGVDYNVLSEGELKKYENLIIDDNL